MTGRELAIRGKPDISVFPRLAVGEDVARERGRRG
jgi:hypothetical protein